MGRVLFSIFFVRSGWGHLTKGGATVDAFVIPPTLYFHRFWPIDDPGQRQAQSTAFYRNIEILGASLVMFGLFASSGSDLRFTLTAPLARG